MGKKFKYEKLTIYYRVWFMPASIRIIKIVKDSMGGEAYTVEFECEAENGKDLVNELLGSPYGQRAIELLNRAEFLPEEKHKTQEELKAEAEREERERRAHEETLKERGRNEMMIKMLSKLRTLHGDKFVEEFAKALNKKEEEEEIIRNLGSDDREPE